MESSLLYILAYIWITASYIITQLIAVSPEYRKYGLENGEKAIVFFFWPILFPVGILIDIFYWMTE